MYQIQLDEWAVKRLPFVAKAGKIYFLTAAGKIGFIYSKYGISFPNNLIQLLADLEGGNKTRIWFDQGLSGKIEIFLNESKKVHGIFSTNDEKLAQDFQKLLKTNQA